MSLIYEPKEDSYLLSEILKKQIPLLLEQNPSLTFLEIGIGSGIQLQTIKDLGIKNIHGVDINPEAVKLCKSKGFSVFISDLFSNISNKYDIIIFNPPYLPESSNEDEESRLATTGGKKGSEIINKFLIQAKNYLEEDGKIFILKSSLTKNINWSGYKKKLVGEKNLFFERLEVWELNKDS